MTNGKSKKLIEILRRHNFPQQISRKFAKVYKLKKLTPI
jgi:hypothetical protein